ncbi:ATP-binding protein [Geobacter sp. SVR]|uniref:sensor histidine kinase n=1 Tax=Geobacter sp. SVR TaxID=2495594 RepID=UPI00143EF6C3|nr:ATP-binding protein [Geobacter sp. SVR]BCS54806.1 hypothetical protein GSVR_31140 [Geobacter sp. SVR]GCF86386.1 hypothetical protein GSbR_29860 [Geobacter sp. SVR]
MANTAEKESFAGPAAADAGDELRDLQQRLQAAELHASEVDREMDQLSYAISHDLRAPLRAVDGFSEILLEDYADRLDDQGKHYLQVIRNNARTLGAGIEALLALARVGRRALQRVDLDMNLLFSQVRTELMAADPERSLAFEIGSLPHAFGDRDMVHDVIRELAGNSVKFTRPRETGVVTISGESDGRECRYTISDNGIGFDMQYADRLFGLFQRLNGSESFEGQGTGLARVRRILDRLGGKIWAQGEDTGAVFSFTLPAAGGTPGTGDR